MRNAVLGDGDQAEGLGRQRIADDLDHLDLRTRGLAHAFGQHEVACLSLAQFADRRTVAHALVDRGEPRLVRAVHFDDAHQAFGACGQLLHRMRDPAARGFLVTREDAVAALDRGDLLAVLHHQPRRLFLAVGRPVLGLGDRFAILDRDDLEHGHLGHAAHAVIGGALAIDEAFLGHVLETLLQRDLFLTLEPEGLGDFALAGGGIGGLDEFEYLLFRRKPLRLPEFVLFCHGRHMGTPGPHVTG